MGFCRKLTLDEATALTEVGSGFTIELTALEFGHYVTKPKRYGYRHQVQAVLLQR